MNRPLVHFSTTSLANSRKATTECHSTYFLSPNSVLVAMRREAALSLAPKKAASAPRLPVKITKLLLKDFCCWLSCALLLNKFLVDFFAVLIFFLLCLFRGLIFFFHLAPAEKNNRRNEHRGQCQERCRTRGKATRLTTWFFVGGRVCVPEVRGKPGTGVARVAWREK